VSVILIGGGARSGKSRFALEKALELTGNEKYFIATATASDQEMADRIQAHKSARSSEFQLVEAPIDLAGALNQIPPSAVVVIDCLTLWLNNLIYQGQEVKIMEVLKAAKSRSGLSIFVGNEVGEGIIPPNELARNFQDQHGWMMQEFAKACDEVFIMHFGIPVKIK
jgi:adenosylcobinamide kinase/adenosylcobinamide-phosphate guanylyltransferase